MELHFEFVIHIGILHCAQDDEGLPCPEGTVYIAHIIGRPFRAVAKAFGDNDWVYARLFLSLRRMTVIFILTGHGIYIIPLYY
jgi:hypothetical protein